MPASAAIRPYDPSRDLSALRTCFIELQDHEHAMIPIAPTGAEIVEAYLPWMLDRLNHFSGHLLLAELDVSTSPDRRPQRQVVGYVSLLNRVPRSSPDDSDEAHALISELCVLQEFRGRGVGAQLLGEAERLAIEAGATNLRLSVVRDNEDARRLYKRLGYEDVAITMWKRLDDAAKPGPAT